MLRHLALESMNLGLIQIFLTMLGALDTVAILVTPLGSIRIASYQAAALIGRVPLFLSAAIGLAAYRRLTVAESDEQVRRGLGDAVRLYLVATIPFVVLCWTVPAQLVHLFIPREYSYAPALLRFTSASGAAIGWIDVVSTAHQARARFRPAIVILSITALLQPGLLILAGSVAGLWWFAGTLVAVSVVSAVLLTFDGRRWLLRGRLSLPCVWIVVGMGAGFASRDIVWLWLLALVLYSTVTFAATYRDWLLASGFPWSTRASGTVPLARTRPGVRLRPPLASAPMLGEDRPTERSGPARNGSKAPTS